MVDFIGILKIKVIKGTNLAIRDIVSSDPYTVLTLGKQVSYFQASNLFLFWGKQFEMCFFRNDYFS